MASTEVKAADWPKMCLVADALRQLICSAGQLKLESDGERHVGQNLFHQSLAVVIARRLHIVGIPRLRTVDGQS